MNSSLFISNKEIIKEILGIDDSAITALDVEFDRYFSMPLLMKHPFFFHGLLSVLTNCLFPLYGIVRNVASKDEDFFFVSCSDTVFRTQNIDMITGGLSFCIIHQPNFHVIEAIQYHKYFKSKGIMAYFPTISFKNIIYAWRKLIEIKHKCIFTQNDMEKQRFLSVLSVFLIYDNVVKDYMRNLAHCNGKWILEHQIHFFVPVITNLRSMGKKSTMLQHGLFFKPTTDFFPLHCDYVLCCSEREKEIYITEGVTSDRINVLGIPLQTLCRKGKSENNDTQQYQLLILLTLIDKRNAPQISEILDYIRKNYKNVLIRFRPRSKDRDMKFLQGHLEGFDISDGETITQDIAKSNKMITFSADAIVEVVNHNKPFIYIWLKEKLSFVKELDCTTIDNYQERIKFLMESDNYTNKMQQMATFLVGEQDPQIISERFNSYILKK